MGGTKADVGVTKSVNMTELLKAKIFTKPIQDESVFVPQTSEQSVEVKREVSVTKILQSKPSTGTVNAHVDAHVGPSEVKRGKQKVMGEKKEALLKHPLPGASTVKVTQILKKQLGLETKEVVKDTVVKESTELTELDRMAAVKGPVTPAEITEAISLLKKEFKIESKPEVVMEAKAKESVVVLPLKAAEVTEDVEISEEKEGKEKEMKRRLQERLAQMKGPKATGQQSKASSGGDATQVFSTLVGTQATSEASTDIAAKLLSALKVSAVSVPLKKETLAMETKENAAAPSVVTKKIVPASVLLRRLPVVKKST
jgi:hypothetical protein